jgi:glycosyltransferase involved in cell wall biosynthesis
MNSTSCAVSKGHIVRIAFIVPSLADRGPIIFTKNLVEGLIGSPSIEMEIFYVRNKIGAVFPVPCTRLTPRTLVRLLKCDVLHSTGFLPDLLVSLLPARRSRKVSSLHNIIEEDMGFTYSRFRARLETSAWLWALGRVGERIYSSPYMAKYYRQRLAPGTDVIIDYGVPATVAGGIDEQDEGTFVELKRRSLKIIGAVCLVIRRKGLDQLVRALRELADCAVVVVGDGPEAEPLRALASELGVADRFRILGFRRGSTRYNRRFDLFAMVSRSEGFCMAMLEAMGSRLPIVCSRLPLYAGLVPEEDVAFFDLNDVDGLVAAIRRLLASEEAYAAASKRLFHERFTIEAMSAKHAAFYQKVCAPPQGSVGQITRNDAGG